MDAHGEEVPSAEIAWEFINEQLYESGEIERPAALPQFSPANSSTTTAALPHPAREGFTPPRSTAVVHPWPRASPHSETLPIVWPGLLSRTGLAIRVSVGQFAWGAAVAAEAARRGIVGRLAGVRAHPAARGAATRIATDKGR